MKAKQFIQDYTRNCSNKLCAVEDKYGKKVISYHEWLTPEQALKAVEIEREEVIEKACKWLGKTYKALWEVVCILMISKSIWRNKYDNKRI